MLIVTVPDTHTALIQLATAWRSQFKYPVVCITGSVGKTSTKEMLCNILDSCGKRFCSFAGNHNTVLGLALKYP